MSRLYPDPLSGSFSLPGTRNLLALTDPFRQRREQSIPIPQVAPDVAEDTLSYLGETSLGGLAHIGKLLDKSFGARAVRGALGGRPEELLSILPLSDTLGITDERNVVTGRQLGEDFGWLEPDADPESFDEDDLAGMAIEMGLDPSTYLGFGALTRAGSIAKKAGGLKRLNRTADRMQGFTARASDIDAAAQAAGVDPFDLTRQLGIDRNRVMGANVERAALAETPTFTYTDPLTGLPSVRKRMDANPVQPARVFDPLSGNLIANPQGPTSLAGAFGVGLPFGTRVPLMTEGPTAEWLARLLPAAVSAPFRAADRATQYLTGFSPTRAARGLFDPDVKGLYSAQGQELGPWVRDREEALRTGGMTEYADVLQRLDPIVGADPDRTRLAMQHMRVGVENAALDPALDARLVNTFTGPELTTLRQIGMDMRTAIQNRRAGTAALGVEAPELVDAAISYFTRSREMLPRQPGESIFNYFNRITREYSARHASQIAREDIWRDVPGGTTQINQWATDPQLSGPARTSTPAQVEAYILGELAPGNPTPPPEVIDQARRLTTWLGSLPPVHAQSGVPFFTEDLPADFLRYVNRDAQARSAAEATYEGIRRYAQPIAPGGAADLVPLDQVLREMGLTGRDAAGQPIAVPMVASQLNINPNDVARMGIPQELYRDMRRLNAAWNNPAELTPILTAWDAVTQMFKTSVTAPFINFYTRNIGTGLFNMWRSGDGAAGALDRQAMGDAWNVVRGYPLSQPLPGMAGGTPAEWTRQLFSEVIGQGLAFVPRNTNTQDVVGAAGEQILRRPNLPQRGGGLLADAAGWLGGFIPEAGRVREQLNPFNVQGVMRDRDVFTAVKQMRAAGEMMENWLRTSHYIALRKQGWAPEAAAWEVKKYQLDYSELTNFERQVMKRVIPWYSFTRRNLPPLIDDVVHNPAKLTATFRGVTGGRTPFEFVPDYIAEGASIPIAGGEEGEQRYISSFGLPIEDEAVKMLGALSRGDLGRTATSLLGMTQPQIKAPLEYTFGTQLYSGRKLQDLRPSELVTLGGAVPEDLARQLTQVIANTPASRLLSTADRVIDDRKDPEIRAINILTGARISDVDAEKQKPIAQKRMLQKQLEGQPGVRKSESVYLSQKALAEGKVTPEELLLYRLYLDADRQIKQAR